MSGILNTTGAVSGIIGTTEATPVSTGTDGYVFTATGAGVAPAWEAVAAANGTVTHHDFWAANAATSGQVDPITAWVRGDEDLGWGRINEDNPMTLSSGIFTFPATGLWRILGHFWIRCDVSSDAGIQEVLFMTLDDSSYSQISNTVGCANLASMGRNDLTLDVDAVVRVTDVDNRKVKFKHQPEITSTDYTAGTTILHAADASGPLTYCSFTRIGDV